MIDPYRTVFISLISFSLLVGSMLFYKYIYPKKNINLFVLFLLIALLPLLSLLRPGTYESGDFNIHIYRVITFYQSLQEGNIMPSWSGELNATYGNPLFIFNYPLPYYLVSFFHFLGFSFVSSMKILLGLTFSLSGIFMYLAIKKMLNNQIAAFTAAVFYLYNPYHLSVLHFRATPGESTVFMLAPLLLYFVTCFLKERKIKYLILTSLTTVLLSLAHPMVSLTVHGIIILFALTFYGVKKRVSAMLYLFTALGIGLVASLYVWLPFLFFSNIISPDPSSSINFAPFAYLFYSPYRYGFLFQGPYGELPFPIGYSQLLVICIGLVLFLKTDFYKKIKIQYIIWFVILFVLIFLMHPTSNIFWQHFEKIWMLGGRLPLPMAICTSVIAGYVALYFSKKNIFKKILFIFIFLTIISTMLNWGHRRVIPVIGDQQLISGVWQSTYILEGPVWFLRTIYTDRDKFVFNKLPKSHLEIIQGEGIVKKLYRNSTKHTYIINAESPITIKENTLWYPGWSLTDNNKKVAIYPGPGGIIHAKLPPGLHYLELSFEDIPAMKLLKNIALGSVILLLLALVATLSGHPKQFARKL